MARNDLQKITRFESDARDLEVDRLTRDLIDERSKRRQDWFFFILTAIILLDIHVFDAYDNWGAPIAILALELILLMLAAQRLGIEAVARWANYMIAKFGKQNND